MIKLEAGMGKAKKLSTEKLAVSLKDAAITVALIVAAFIICALLRFAAEGDVYVPLIFVLAVVIISRLTNGYFWGVIASFAAVFGVNYAFTYPYFEFNFTISGYPLTFITMLAVSIIMSTMTTQVKRHEQIKAQSEREMMRANLLRAISHDLRTPLTSIIGSASAIIDNDDHLSSQQRKELLNGVKEEAQWLIRMVENLLSITHINGETYALNKKPEAVEEILGEAVQKFKKQFEDIELAVNIPDEVFFVPMDAMLIEQVLTNLLHNAAEHGKTTTKIDVSVRREKEWASFSVSDNGSGIDENKLAAIFDGNLHGAENRKTSDYTRNMGIGLSVCRTIVEAHGGSMYAENLPFGGAKFCFKLPLE